MTDERPRALAPSISGPLLSLIGGPGKTFLARKAGHSYDSN